MSALENFQQTVGALYPVEFPFGAFSKMKKKKKKAQRPRLEREMVEICEKWVCLASSAPLWRYSVTSVLELSISWNFLSGPECPIHLILLCDLYAPPLSLLKTHMHTKRCFSRMPLSCRRRICRIKVSQQVTWRWLTQTRVHGLWTRLVITFFRALLLFFFSGLVAITFCVRWGIYSVGYEFFCSFFCLEVRKTIDSS